MENQYQKIVNLSYLAFAALVYFVVFTALTKLGSIYDIESRVKAAEFIIRGASIALGAGLFVGLYKNTTANTFMTEVASELLGKVTWPTSKDTWSATAVVIITVVIAGVVLALFDWMFTASLQSLWTTAERWFF